MYHITTTKDSMTHTLGATKFFLQFYYFTHLSVEFYRARYELVSI